MSVPSTPIYTGFDPKVLTVPLWTISIFIFIFLLNISITHAQHTGAPVTWNVREIMSQLQGQGYWVDTAVSPITSVNKQAIVSFQKVNRLKRTGKLTDYLVQMIRQTPRPVIKDSIHLFHIEVDLNRQVLFIADSADSLLRIVPVSTGNGKEFIHPEKGPEFARTPRGKFKVYYKIKGWHKSELGLLYDPLYVYGGFAIHGAESVPAYPASHGCVRIPVYAAEVLYPIIPIGTPVIIFGNNPVATP